MKIEQILVQQLYKEKEFTLQGIGTFRLDPSVPTPADLDKEIAVPESAVTFEYNPKATEDQSLLTFIVQQTKKIKPLASADLDSYLMLGRQFLNIGKPFVIDGIGTLEKSQVRELEFIPGVFVLPKMNPNKANKENVNEESSGLFQDYNDKPSYNGRTIFLVVVTLAIVGGIVWGAYHFMSGRKAAVPAPVQQTVLDSVGNKPSPDTASNQIKTVTAVPSIQGATPGNEGFKVIFKQTNNKEAASATMKKLNGWGHHVVMYTTDSVNFKLAEVFSRPLSDTAKVRDSLSHFYNEKAFVDLRK